MSSQRTTQSSVERDLDALVPDEKLAEVSPTSEQAVTDLLLGSLRPVRPMPSRSMLVAAFLAIFAIVTSAFVALIGTRGAENMTAPQLAGVLSAVLLAAFASALSLSGDMTPGRRRFIHPMLLISGVLVVFFALVVGLFPWSAGMVQGWHCFQSGFLCSLPAATLVLLVVRKGAPLAWGVVGATAGLLGGLVGMAAIHVGCSLLSAPHMAAGHLTIPLAGAVGGFLVGKALPYLLSR